MLRTLLVQQCPRYRAGQPGDGDDDGGDGGGGGGGGGHGPSEDDQLYHLIVNHTLLCIGILDRWVVISHKVALKGNAIRKSFFCHKSTVVERV